ncbi:MAG: CHRD domain-containing protein [Blastocatellia bacterium]
MRRRLSLFLLATISLILLNTEAKAEIFVAYLSSAQEVPTNASTATGYARVVLNEAAGTINFTVVFNGLTSNQTAAHIHAPAPIGTNVGVAINFGAVGGTSGTITGVAAITPTQIAQLRAHQGYVNVHSVNFGPGEIRGQLGIPRPVDYDGDGRMDLSVLRFPNVAPPGVAQITYWNQTSSSGVQVANWGNANTDFPAPGDYDGDGKGDLAVYRNGQSAGALGAFFILRSSDSTFQIFNYGVFGDQVVARDYDGDGRTDPAIFRPGAAAGQQAFWWIKRSTVPAGDLVIPFGTTGVVGTSGDTPVPGDYDGDGKFDIAVYRFGGLSPNNNFIILRSLDGAVLFQQWGNFTTDYIVPGDYDGDGKYDLAAARTGATGTSPMVWWILQSSNGQSRVQTFGISSDRPAQGDYDGDARTDIAVHRGTGSTFWVFNSFTNVGTPTQFGITNDFPVNSFDIR